MKVYFLGCLLGASDVLQYKVSTEISVDQQNHPSCSVETRNRDLFDGSVAKTVSMLCQCYQRKQKEHYFCFLSEGLLLLYHVLAI